ncbi:MAG: hypothetical protein RSB70_00375 [Clostridium sp.]
MRLFKKYLITLLIFIILNNNLYISAFANNKDLRSNYKSISIDLNRDGINDTIFITLNEDNTYNIQATINKNNIPLFPEKKIKIIGHYRDYWPLSVTMKDLNRDNIPEILIQASYSDRAVQHIFQYINGIFVNISTEEKNILGFMDTTNNQSPKLLIGNFYNGEIFFKNYMVNSNGLSEFTNNPKEDFMGKFTISNLISYIESLPYSDYSICNNFFSNILSEERVKLLDSLRWNDFRYKFQDAFFYDISSDNNGSIREVKWKLNFKGTSDSGESKNFTLTLVLSNLNNLNSENTSSYEYKITYLGIDNVNNTFVN